MSTVVPGGSEVKCAVCFSPEIPLESKKLPLVNQNGCVARHELISTDWRSVMESCSVGNAKSFSLFRRGAWAWEYIIESTRHPSAWGVSVVQMDLTTPLKEEVIRPAEMCDVGVPESSSACRWVFHQKQTCATKRLSTLPITILSSSSLAALFANGVSDSCRRFCVQKRC